MASSSSHPMTPQAVMGHVQKLGDADPDFRFMALNDLLQMLSVSKADFLHHDYNIAARTVDSVIKTLDDHNGEVQNLAIRCLGPLVERIPPTIVAPMIDKVSSLKLKNSVDNAIPSMALRAVIMALPHPVPGLPTPPDVESAYQAVSRVLIPRLIGPGPKTRVPQTTNISLPDVPTGLLQENVNAEAVDVLIEVVRCFGPLLQQIEVEAMQDAVMQLLEGDSATSVVKKRAVVAISMLALYLSDDHLNTVLQRLTSGLSQPKTSPVTRRLYISIMGSMARSIPARFGPHLEVAAPHILKALGEDELAEHMEKVSDGEDMGPEFNEVRESSLVALEAFLASCPQEMKPFTDDVITSCLRFLKFDPNYAVNDDDDEEMDEDDDDDFCDDDDDEFDGDDGFEDDDDDASWKVRRCAAKAIYTLISTRGSGDLMDNGVLYGKAAPSLIKRIDEREENVRLEVISALALLVRKTGEGLHTVDLPFDDLESEFVPQIPISRKRRRQSSGGGSNLSKFMTAPGLTSPVLEKVPAHGPRADLSKLTPTIIKAASKQLKTKSVASKHAVINLLDDLVSVQRGGLADYLDELISLIIDAVQPVGAGSISASITTSSSSSSATPSSLRTSALRLISDISRTHPSATLQPYLSKIVAGVTSAVHDRFYKISSEALRTSEELAKAITPPRSRGAGTKYADELNKLYEVIIERASANDADTEVRQRAIHALGILISRTSGTDGTALISAEKRENGLNILKDRVKNETTRIAAVRAIDSVAAFSTTVGQLSKPWTQEVVLELTTQLRKANRSVRNSSIHALKQLVLCKAVDGQLEENTIKAIASALLPAITNTDAQLLGPSLLILAHLVPAQPNLIATPDTVTAISELLKSHGSGIVLDQILVFVTAVGAAGVGEDLMMGLLKNVSVIGEPQVVGKVIGTLLVAGSPFTAVSLDSFTSELTTSAKSGDDAKISLALAILGEAGMKLGPKSPLAADLFLGQFRVEPDKVSLAAAIALGRAGSSNAPVFLPVILNKMEGGGNTQYLLIQSIKEILQSLTMQSAELQQFADPIWNHLVTASDNADNKVICAECIGRLVTLDPSNFIPKLQDLLKDQNAGLRALAVQAVRYMLPESDDAFDAALRSVLNDMLLAMLQDSDMEIRRLAMSTLNSAAHNKPDFILPHLGELLPFVLKESVINPSLIREVMLGPFKHTVDDGLEVRKSAYETLYALMDTAFSRINNIDFYDRVVAGLKDDNDIRQLCNLMVTKLTVLDPDETARRLDSIAEAYRAVLSVKLKDNAVKQDVEKQEEANKSVLRVTLLLGESMKAKVGNASAVTSNAGPSGVWAAYWEWVNKECAPQVKRLMDERQDSVARFD